ncbi:hypothetical protein NEDG_00031 [Nematocida displodere]|uniref:Cullin family profile domain-containing protein n=1 Tax=Nematocida displodere TaxID=1805483 RepID=A0A177EIK7_9MICR|nr:hypothetical protein NEDG_00031 [Nematocida displodere]
MDPLPAKLTPERFTRIWDTFQREANKLASGVPCSAMVIYNIVYQVGISLNTTLTLRFHWCIGKYFFGLCAQMKERIDGDNWVQEYASAFAKYERTVEALEMLSPHLNDALEAIKECRRVKDLGYTVWERSILRHRYDKRLPPLHEALPHHREYAPICLRSLEKIVTDSKERLDYYRNNYETGLIKIAVGDFKKRIGLYAGGPLQERFALACSAIQGVLETYTPLLLPASHALLETMLEKSVFTGNTYWLTTEMLQILQKDPRSNIHRLCISVTALPREIFPLFLSVVRAFTADYWPRTGLCRDLARAHRELASLLAPGGCPQTLAVLCSSLSEQIEKPGAGMKLYRYLEEAILAEDLEDIGSFQTLIGCISLEEEKKIFYRAYIEGLMGRVLSTSAVSEIEKVVIEAIVLPWEYKRKVTRIIEDIGRSNKVNEHFESIYGRGDHHYAMDSRLFHFHVTVTTACMWPITDDALVGVKIPRPLEDILTMFHNLYVTRYRRRRLFWADTLSIIQIEVETDRIYTIEMTLVHYAILMALSAQSLSLDVLSAEVKLSTAATACSVDNLFSHGLLVFENGLYAFNTAFTSPVSALTIKMEGVAPSRVGTRKPYYQAWISQRVKASKTIPFTELYNSSKETALSFEWSHSEFVAALTGLKEKGLLDVDGANVLYVP